MKYAFANLDFATGQHVDQHIVDELLADDPDLMGFVEAKVDNVGQMVPTGWTVAQSMRNKAEQGVAVAWRPDRVALYRKRPLHVGTRPRGARMLTRWMRVIDVEMGGVKVRLIFTHYPPRRYRFLWRGFNLAVKARLKAVAWSRSGRWAVFSDYNAPIQQRAKELGGKAYGEGIIGVVIGPAMKVTDHDVIRKIKRKGWTDHVGVVGDLSVKGASNLSTSQNGWPVYTSSGPLAVLTWITGRVAPGSVHTVFDAFCRRFNAEVEHIDQASSWGWNYRSIRGQSTGFSNHASGTAIDLNAPKHPLGKRGTFAAKQRDAIHALLRDFDGVIRWGGDYQNRADEMHFEINVGAAATAALAAKLTAPKKRAKPKRKKSRGHNVEDAIGGLTDAQKYAKAKGWPGKLHKLKHALAILRSIGKR